MRNLLGMPGRIFDSDRATPAGSDHGKPLEARRVDDAFEIAYPGLERKILGVAIRESTAAGVVSEQFVVTREDVQPRPPGKAAPLVLEMREPGRRHHQRRSVAAHRISEANAVRRRTETDVLLHGAGPCWTRLHCTT